MVENQGDHHFSPESVIKKPNQLDHTFLLVWFSLALDFWGTLELSLNFSIFIFHKLDHVSSDADIIHDRTKFRGSEYLVWLVITQWIGSPSVDYLVCFFDHIFLMIFGEKWWCPWIAVFSSGCIAHYFESRSRLLTLHSL